MFSLLLVSYVSVFFVMCSWSSQSVDNLFDILIDMELSSEVYDLLERFKTLPKQNGECRDNLERMSRHETRGDDEIIHLEEIEFRNDETW